MAALKCRRCLQLISLEDTIQFENAQVVHADCRRRRDLSAVERVLLFRYCWSHPVANCVACGQRFRQQELGMDLIGHRSFVCPRCRVDLTERLREHLYGCTMLPGEVRRRAREARAAAQRLVKNSHQLSDRADVLMREAEAAIAALRETMRRVAGG